MRRRELKKGEVRVKEIFKSGESKAIHYYKIKNMDRWKLNKIYNKQEEYWEEKLRG